MKRKITTKTDIDIIDLRKDLINIKIPDLTKDDLDNKIKILTETRIFPTIDIDIPIPGVKLPRKRSTQKASGAKTREK